MKLENVWYLYLVGGWTNPFEKYARQIGPFPQNGGENKKDIWNPQLVMYSLWENPLHASANQMILQILVVNLNEIWTAWI